MDTRTLVDGRHLTSELFSARLEHGSVLSSYHQGWHWQQSNGYSPDLRSCLKQETIPTKVLLYSMLLASSPCSRGACCYMVSNGCFRHTGNQFIPLLFLLIGWESYPLSEGQDKQTLRLYLNFDLAFVHPSPLSVPIACKSSGCILKD